MFGMGTGVTLAVKSPANLRRALGKSITCSLLSSTGSFSRTIVAIWRHSNFDLSQRNRLGMFLVRITRLCLVECSSAVYAAQS